MINTCASCLIPAAIYTHDILQSYAKWSSKWDKSQNYIRAVVLTDCANAYASIFGISAASSEKSTRLLLAHIRDNIPTVDVSYIDSLFNIADVGAKLRASREIWKKLVS